MLFFKRFFKKQVVMQACRYYITKKIYYYNKNYKLKKTFNTWV